MGRERGILGSICWVWSGACRCGFVIVFDEEEFPLKGAVYVGILAKEGLAICVFVRGRWVGVAD